MPGGLTMRCSLFAILWIVFLSGCESTPELSPTLSTPPQSQIVRRDSATRPKAIQIVRGTSWLLDTIQASTARLPASVMIKGIAGTRPVRFSFALGEDPLVQLRGDEKTIKEQLDTIALAANWAYTATKVGLTVSEMEMRFFDLPTLPLDLDGTMVLRGLGSEDQASGSKNDATIKSEAYEGLLAYLGISDETPGGQWKGANFSLAKEYGQLKVTARPDDMREIANAIEKHNERASRRISVEFVLFSTNVTHTRDRAVDVNILRDSMAAAQFSFPATTVIGLAGNAGLLKFTATDQDRWSGTTATLKWLTQQGATEIKMRRHVEPVLNRLVTIEDRVVMPYISKVSHETTISGSSERALPTITTEKLTTGIVLNFIVTTYRDTIRIRLNYAQAELISKEKYSYEDGAIAGELPVWKDVNHTIPFILRNGESRIITNLSRTVHNFKDAQTPILPWVGDATSGKEQVTETVLLVTARMVD